MNAKPWQGLVKGNYSLWLVPNSIHRHQYSRWVGFSEHVGIELETHEVIDDSLFLAVKKSYERLVTRSNPEGYNQQLYNMYTVKLSNRREIQVLFNTTDPVRFVKNMYAFVQACAENNFPLGGSVHVNVQIPQKTWEKYFQGRMRKCMYIVTYYRSDVYYPEQGTMLRQEIKAGPSFYGPEEFVANMFVVLAYYKSGKDISAFVEPAVPKFCLLRPSTYIAALKKHR
jgi:hypothetical protein